MKDPAHAPTTAFTPAIFLALSCGLTGSSPSQLRISEEAEDMFPRFHAAVAENVPSELLEKLSGVFLAADTVAEGAADVLVDPVLAPVGRSIIRLWRTGAWHDPATPSHPPRVVAGEHYRKSAVWHTLQVRAGNDGVPASGA